MRTPRRLSFVLLLATACGAPAPRATDARSQKRSVHAPEADEEPSQPASSEPAESANVAAVRLIDPGTEPRSRLRMKLEAGSSETMVMVMRMRVDTTVGKGMKSQVAPDMVQHLKMRVAEVRPDGRARIDFVVSKAEARETKGVDSALVVAVSTALRGMVGMQGHTLMTNRGVVESGDVQVPPNASPALREMADQVRQSLTQFASPVPEEPVGVGGVWEVTTRPLAGGVRVTQKARQTLVERSGATVRTRAVVTSTAEPQPMRNTKLPPGARADLVSLEVNGKGSAQWSLLHMVPERSVVHVTSTLDATVSLGEETLPMRTETDLDMEITRAP
jgi:hypothetical protein